MNGASFVAMLWSVAVQAWAPRPVSLGGLGCESLENLANRASCIRGAFFFVTEELSFDGRASCASCHQATRIGGQLRFLEDGRPRPVLRGKSLVRARTISLLDVGWKAKNAGDQSVFLFWNGRSHSYDSVSFWPLFAPDELAVRLEALERFGGVDSVAKDLGVFLTVQSSGPAPFDDFLAGKFDALSLGQLEGLQFLLQAGCQNCHSGREFSEVQEIGQSERVQKRVALQYANLPKDFFSLAEAVYVTDAALFAKPARKIVLQSVPQSLRNLSVHAGSVRYFGRFGQASSLEEFLPLHCEQFPQKSLQAKCMTSMKDLKKVSHVVDFLKRALLSKEFQTDVMAAAE